MLESSEAPSPPPLHYSPAISDHDRTSTRESTPISTPVGFGVPSSRRPEREKGFFSWDYKPPEADSHISYIDTTLTEPNHYEDIYFPLFPPSPPDTTMSGRAAPIDIATRQTSVSPPGQQASNLTSALLRAGNGDRSANFSSPNGMSTGLKTIAARKDSIGASMTQWTSGTKPISVSGSNRERPRRESLAGSLVGGMSWGGVSVGSWIRDDIIMTGTSPFTFQSPSFHSSSYLPKLEANFMRDFSCCGVMLPTLHDLLQHYEEAHAQKLPQNGHRASNVENRAAVAAAVATHQQSQQPSNSHDRGMQSERPTGGQRKFGQNQHGQQHDQIDGNSFASGRQNLDLDTIDDMELDDAMGVTDGPSSQLFSSQSRDSAHGRYSHQNQRVPPLNLTMLQGHQGLRGSQPGTPVAPGRPLPLQNNPTVSSVNTPTLMSNPLQTTHYRNTPDSSGPGTPVELDENVIGGFGDLSMQSNALQNQSQFPGFGGSDMVELCIDEPAKRLFSPSGGYNAMSQIHTRLGNAQYGPNSEIARRIREQQMLAGVPDTAAGMLPNDEPKPFRCPVIGCEKAYKNQNGLKYHKTHGHNNQQLHDNADGTFSIVNPETATPYPGTLGMEKEKPYKCEVCGKRYKNLNGLKYHKSHSTTCNSDLQPAAGRNVGGVMQGQNINVAGAGLPGIGEEGLL